MSLLRIATILSVVVAVVAPPPRGYSSGPNRQRSGGTNTANPNPNPNYKVPVVIPPTQLNLDLDTSAPFLQGSNVRSSRPRSRRPFNSYETERSDSNISIVDRSDNNNSVLGTPKSVYRKESKYRSRGGSRTSRTPSGKSGRSVQWADPIHSFDTDERLQGTTQIPGFQTKDTVQIENTEPKVQSPETPVLEKVKKDPNSMSNQYSPARSRKLSQAPIKIELEDEVPDDGSDPVPTKLLLPSKFGPVVSPRLQAFRQSNSPATTFETFAKNGYKWLLPDPNG
ncbi:hypothetical protein DRE_04004 [Drechslerella stenobrocha 248]|uniref:Uncharacterized protein n=1 Tax=Drechslerella stenobrocha 248 TaxID=1043628 RepID=W7HTL6_9PEZI|nr:hypothetical protein DRE_04004 [Drechslerella stenobrocha 248]